MAVKRPRDDGASHHTVFVNTSLGANLALIVSDSDSVSDLKKKIVQEHLSLFPEMRDLKISRVKVQRKGSYYYLPDPMLVISAFEHIKRDWFVSLDASSSQGNGNNQGLLCITYPQTDQTGPFKTMAKPSVSNTNTNLLKDIAHGLSPGTCHVAKKRKLNSADDNHRNDLKMAIPESSSSDRSLNAALTETLKDKSVRADTAHNNRKKRKKKKKKGKNSSMCHDEVACTVPSFTENVKGNKRFEKNEGVEMKIFDKPTGVDSTIHVTQSGSKETDEQKEVTPNCHLEIPICDKFGDASNKDQVPFHQLEDPKGAAESSIGRKKISTKKSTPRHVLDVKNVVDDSSDATTKLGSIVPKTGVEHKNEIGKDDNLLITQVAETSLPSDNNKNKLTGETEEQTLSAEKTLDDKVELESGNASRKQNEKRHRRSAENIPGKFDGEDEPRKKDENLSDAGKVQMDSVQAQSADTKAEMTIKEVENVSVAPSAVNRIGRKKISTKKSTPRHVLDVKNVVDDSSDATTKLVPKTKNVVGDSSDATTKLGSIVPKTGVEHKNEIGKGDNSLITQVAETSLPSDNNKNKVTGETKEQTLSAEKTLDDKVELESGNASSRKQNEKRHRRSAENMPGKLDGEDEQRKKGENLSDAGKVQMDSVQAHSADTKAEMTIKEVENVSVAPSDVKVAGGHRNTGRSKKRRTKKDEVSASTDDVPGAPLDPQGSNQDNNVSPATEGKGELVPVEEKGIEIGHLLLNHTDKDQESERLVQKKPIKKTKKSQSPKKSKCITAIQEEVGVTQLAASNDNLRDTNFLPAPMEMDVSAKNSNADKLDVSKLENPGTDSSLKSSGEVVGNADSFRAPPHPLAKGTLEEMHDPEVNSDKSESIDFKQYFVPVQQQGEVDSKNPTKSTKNTKVGSKSKEGVTSRSVKADKTLEEAGKLATVDASTYKKERKESIDDSMYSSSSKGSDRLPEQAAPEIQSSATRNTKMRSRKGESSDSSTYTPSDDSSSSGYSVDGSEISQASTPTGGDGAKSKGAGAKPKVKPNLLGQKMTMDLILRRSSRFKKAKVTAAQCLDEESQPVDVVPDSQADGQNQ